MTDRVILHVDCNSFFASVEASLNPALKNVPMAVCGSVEDRHGIVLAKNELAKKYGIATAETVFSAKRKCRELVICEPHYDLYEEFSKRANAIYAEYTDLVEPFGIDESWLDVTASGYLGTGEEIAEKIRQRVKSELGITVSIGVSFNKVFAKLGSDYKKPDAITVISRENFKSIVYPLPASDLLFVGKRTYEELKRIGIRTVGDLASLSPEVLKSKFGKQGLMLSAYARGEDNSPVEVSDKDDIKSVSQGYTFNRDLTDLEDCRAGIDYLSLRIAERMRAHGQNCLGVAITVKDPNMRSLQRQRTLKYATSDSREIAEVAFELLKSEWAVGRVVRMITVHAINLVKADCATMQLDFFSEGIDEDLKKRSKREVAIDEIRKKYGDDGILIGSVINTDFGILKKRKKP